MKRIDAHTVELTGSELEAQVKFNERLDEGHDTPFSAKLALKAMIGDAKRGDSDFPSDEFIAYLSEGTCIRHGDTIHIIGGESTSAIKRED